MIGVMAMSEEQYITVAEVKELLAEENERRTKLMKENQIAPAVSYKTDENEEVVVEEEETAFNQVQKEAMAHAEATSGISKQNAQKLVKELKGISYTDSGVAEVMKNGVTASKIADALPKYPEEVRAIFYRERVKLEADDIAKIIDTVKKYL